MLGLLKVREDFGPLLEFIRPMMLDPERVVHQGLGWFLREAWKKQPKPVEAFLLEWKDTAPRLIFQYATEKMTAAARARFRREKSRKHLAS
jgi:3-methyladenine DNA glycosylase AlkD